ncbi:MAG: heparinase II/III family protein [Planctomycetes bacterium]|nr:heparinase II/III family protein [Planctomycetota bacterium]
MSQRAQIRGEIRRRADHHLAQDRLLVDYYRIRRRVSFPLPVTRMDMLRMPIDMDMQAGMAYPWATWLTWDLEERIHCLGWAGHHLEDSAARRTVARDLLALARWPTWRQYDKPDLSLGHCARTLVTAHTRWPWLAPSVRREIARAFTRMLDDNLPLCDRYFGAWSRKEDILALADPRIALHNIPIIGTVGLALAAHAICHPAAAHLDRRLHMIYGALLDLLERGFTEGLAYDGYILDFVAMWLEELPERERQPIVDHPRFLQFFEESCLLSAPGDAVQVAELSDVEPLRMPFHLTAHAKCLALRADPRLRWYLDRCDLRAMRCEALAEMLAAPSKPIIRSVAAGATDAHYALVLRSGWETRDLAVAMSCTTSSMHHMHDDDGSIVIGTAGSWLIADPGYQQYLKKKEREFTIGLDAHNAPVINGVAQNAKACTRTALERTGGTCRAELDLTACYPADLGMTRVTRTVWLSGRDLVVVADRVVGANVSSVRYHWHAHPDAAWWWEDGAAMIRLGDTALWVQCPGTAVSDADITRLPGSRGHLSLRAQLPGADGIHWWIFSIGAKRLAVVRSARAVRIDGRRFEL